MPTYQMTIPRWISGLMIVLSLILGYFFISNALLAEDTSFLIYGILIFSAIIGISIYQLVTGKSPYKFIQTK